MVSIRWSHSYMFFIVVMVLLSESTSKPTYLDSICSNTTFANNTQYQTNLNSLFRALSSNATSNQNGFYYTSVANGTKDATYGLFLCRGDQNITACSDCVASATTNLPQKDCPNKDVAATWYDECMVRYSNTSIYQSMELRPRFGLMNTGNVTGNITKFTEVLGNMMDVLAVRAADGGSNKKYATDIVTYTSLQTLYGLVQCTPDLNSSQCDQCLTFAIRSLPISLGGRVVQPSCSVRYEVYPFFNGAANLTASSPSATAGPPSTTPSGTPPLGPPNERRRKASTTVIVAIVIPVAIVFVASLVLYIYYITKNAKKRKAAFDDTEGEFTIDIDSLQYDFQTVVHATDNFSIDNKLGEGGFCTVYKGMLSNGEEIAVKRLSENAAHGALELKNEVLVVAKLQHRNLVRLLGFCLAGEEKLLIYEYVPNMSLDTFLFDPNKSSELNWPTRYKIIQGIARGMLYLHQDSRLTIIHRDLKPSNILLDTHMSPKISDFGMARMFGGDQAEGITNRVVGTYGYMSPEYAMHGQFSIKSDVYSFGVLVFEIISGKRNEPGNDNNNLLSNAWQKWQEGRLNEFTDPSIIESYSSHEVIRCIHLGLLCVNESPDNRPTMATIVLTLDSSSVTLPMPQEPAIVTNIIRVETIQGNRLSSGQELSSSSVNSASLSEVGPR